MFGKRKGRKEKRKAYEAKQAEFMRLLEQEVEDIAHVVRIQEKKIEMVGEAKRLWGIIWTKGDKIIRETIPAATKKQIEFLKRDLRLLESEDKFVQLFQAEIEGARSFLKDAVGGAFGEEEVYAFRRLMQEFNEAKAIILEFRDKAHGSIASLIGNLNLELHTFEDQHIWQIIKEDANVTANLEENKRKITNTEEFVAREAAELNTRFKDYKSLKEQLTEQRRKKEVLDRLMPENSYGAFIYVAGRIMSRGGSDFNDYGEWHSDFIRAQKNLILKPYVRDTRLPPDYFINQVLLPTKQRLGIEGNFNLGYHHDLEKIARLIAQEDLGIISGNLSLKMGELLTAALNPQKESYFICFCMRTLKTFDYRSSGGRDVNVLMVCEKETQDNIIGYLKQKKEVEPVLRRIFSPPEKFPKTNVRNGILNNIDYSRKIKFIHI